MAAARPRSVRSLALGAGLLASALLLTGCSAIFGPQEAQRDTPDGEVTAASDANVFSLQVGDCVYQDESDAAAEEHASLPVVPCAEPHNGEIYAEVELDEGEFPGDTKVQELAVDYCYEQFADFVGLSYDESTLFLWPMFPSKDSWEVQGDRVVQCFIGHESSTETVTGSLKDAGI